MAIHDYLDRELHRRTREQDQKVSTEGRFRQLGHTPPPDDEAEPPVVGTHTPGPGTPT